MPAVVQYGDPLYAMVADGAACTTTGIEADALPQALDTVTWYVPVVAPATVTFEDAALGEKVPVPVQAYVIGPDPVVLMERSSTWLEQIGELLFVPMTAGVTQLVVPLQTQSAPQVSPEVFGSRSSQGVPGSALPPGTPKQSGPQTPALTELPNTCPVTL